LPRGQGQRGRIAAQVVEELRHCGCGQVRQENEPAAVEDGQSAVAGLSSVLLGVSLRQQKAAEIVQMFAQRSLALLLEGIA
jgi:hypothetical protein